MMECIHKGRRVQVIKDDNTGKTTEFFACEQLTICSPTVDGFKQADGSDVPLCSEACPLRELKAKRQVPPVQISLEPVGDRLSEILSECGIGDPNCGECKKWIAQMNAWGISGCEQNSASIITRLNSEAKKASWISWAKVAAKGYTSSLALLNEAIKRASVIQ